MTAQSDKLLMYAILKVVSNRIGKDNAIRRGDLLNMLRLHGYGDGLKDITFDRRIRECIEQLRNSDPKGAYIVSDNAGTGYWFAENLTELEQYLMAERGRGVAILSKVSAQSKRAGIILKGQVSYA